MSQLVLSLFPGIGLLDMAFELEGFTVVRGPDVLWGGDIRRFHPPRGKFDGIIGGPPCQTFSSLAHLVRANGHEPKFGNLIPEYERRVSEAAPDWFLMENVPQAPELKIDGYNVHSFLLDNSMLAGEDGYGQEQRRVRRFSFGVRYQWTNRDGTPNREAPNLMRWIDLAVFLLPDADRTVSAEQKQRTRRQAVLSNPSAVPVKIGGSGKVKRTVKRAVSAGAGGLGPGRPEHTEAHTKQGRYRLADALRLQGLPEDFLEHAPFTAEGKLKAIANGVPVMMGRAIARAILAAIQNSEVP